MTMVPASASDLDRHLAALKESVSDALPPPGTGRAVAAAIAREQRSPARGPRVRNGDRWLAWPLALAASIALLSFVVRSLPPEATVAEPASSLAADDEFLPVVPLADIERAQDAMVVQARLPRTTVAQLGLPINPARAADAIEAELLVRRDGSVLAVRFVY
jgi:hypothetical protein